MLGKRLMPIFLITSMVTTCVPVSLYASASSAAQSINEGMVTTAGTGLSLVGKDMTVSAIDIAATGDAITVGDLTTEASAQDLEKIINAVKSRITVPETYTEFDYYYSNGDNNSSIVWDLNWSEKDDSDSISVECDQNGNIIYYYSYKYHSGNYAPKYQKSELKVNADNFIKKVAPGLTTKIEYIPSDSKDVYGGVYSYTYERVENGIPMPDNTITVGVNYETGAVVSYNSSWLYNVDIPSLEVKVTKEQAAAKIGKTVTMTLAYENAYTTDEDGNTKIKAFLVYKPDKDYVSVDAKTGKVYTTQNEWVDSSKDTGASMGGGTESAAYDKNLSEQEILEVDKLKGLISQEEAIKVVTENKNLLLDSNLKSITASLYKQNGYNDSSKDDKYVWYINLSDPREVTDDSTDTYRAYAYATVDAVTGKLLSFNSSVKDYYNMTEKEWESVEVKYSLEEGREIFEKFVKEQIPSLFKNSVFTNNNTDYIIAYDKSGSALYGGYNYNYDRVNEGIDYSYNGIYGAVDGVTGKIYSFSYNWDEDVEFEAPKNIISTEKAFDYYISNDDFHLVYEINSVHSYGDTNETISTDDYSVKNEVRLVYRTDISPNYISPFTGKQLDSDGNEYQETESSYKYSDIGDSSSSRNIELLADIGIGFEGGEFKPNTAITTKELTEFLSLAGFYYDENEYKISNDSSTISREEAAKFAIQVLGYDSVAKIKGIYNTDFTDQTQIDDENIGFIALASGLSLIKADSENKIRPEDKLTRAEAADLIIGMLSVK